MPGIVCGRPLRPLCRVFDVLGPNEGSSVEGFARLNEIADRFKAAVGIVTTVEGQANLPRGWWNFRASPVVLQPCSHETAKAPST